MKVAMKMTMMTMVTIMMVKIMKTMMVCDIMGLVSAS